MLKIEKSKSSGVVLAMGLLLSGTVFAQEQQILLLEKRASDGSREAVLFYEVSNDELTAGIGFRIHFASRNVNVLAFKNYLELSNVGLDIMTDTDDLDHDPQTDLYINAAWVDLNGEWPSGITFPVKLFSFRFDAIAVQAVELFNIRQSSSPVGFEFASTIATK